MWRIAARNAASEAAATDAQAEWDSRAAVAAFRRARAEVDALIAEMRADRTRLLAAMAICWLDIWRMSVGCRAMSLCRRFIVASGPAAGRCELLGLRCVGECPFPSAFVLPARAEPEAKESRVQAESER